MRRLSILALIVTVFVVILALALAATASALITDGLTHRALARHEQAVRRGDVAEQTASYVELVQAIESGTRVTLAVRGASFLLGLALAIVVYRRVARLVGAVEGFAGRIEGGDLDARLAATDGGETARLAGALNRMMDRLRAAGATEAALRRRLDYLVAASPAVIYAARAEGDYGATYISPNIRAQLGYAPEDFTGDPGFRANHIHPEDRERVLAQMDELPAAGRIEVEYRFRAAAGDWRWMHDEMVLLRDAGGQPVEVVGSWLDISTRKHLEQAIARGDAILHAVAYGSMRFLHASAQTQEAQWNLTVAAVLSHLGEAAEVSRVWIGENLRQPDGDTAMHIAHHWAQPAYSLRGNTPLLEARFSYHDMGMGVEALRLRRGDLLQLRRAELPAPVRARFEQLGTRAQLLAPIMTDEQWWGFIALDDCVAERTWSATELEALRTAANLIGAALAARARQAELRDSLETLGSVLEKLKRQSVEIKRQNTELAQVSRMKSEFLATVTHELKTPLNAIIGFADLLDAGLAGALTAEQQPHVHEILLASHRLLALVNRLLTLARLDTGEAAVTPQAIDAGALLASVATAHAAAARARGISIGVDAADGIIAEADPHLLRLLLDELVDNAIKFNRDNGRVTLRARFVDDRLEIAVTDSGEGIGAADRARLFQPFLQLDGALARRQGGSGIGLMLARRIAELHGGDIGVDSTPGTGSTFTVRLPAAPKETRA